MKGRFRQVVNLLCILILLGTMVYLMVFWGRIPAEEAALDGLARGSASRPSLIILLVVSGFLFAGLTMAEQLPKLFQGNVQLREDTEKLINQLIKMVQSLKLALVILFCYLLVYSAGVHDLPQFLLPVILAVTVGILAVNLLRLNWMRKNA